MIRPEPRSGRWARRAAVMSERENIFVAGVGKPSELYLLLVDRFGLQYMGGEDPQASEDVGFRGRALTADGFVGLRVYPKILLTRTPRRTRCKPSMYTLCRSTSGFPVPVAALGYQDRRYGWLTGRSQT